MAVAVIKGGLVARDGPRAAQCKALPQVSIPSKTATERQKKMVYIRGVNDGALPTAWGLYSLLCQCSHSMHPCRHVKRDLVISALLS